MISGPASGLRRFRDPAPRAQPGERCELCAEPIGAEHGHVIDLESRSIRCACRGCYLLFTVDGAGGQRMRAVPDRYRVVPGTGAALWDSSDIPVKLAFLFRNSVLDRTIVCYPSPAGATESELTFGEPAEVAQLRPDVEALLYRENECYLVPIDRCYELVGLVRLHWHGFDGGDDAREAIARFFDDVRARADG